MIKSYLDEYGLEGEWRLEDALSETPQPALEHNAYVPPRLLVCLDLCASSRERVSFFPPPPPFFSNQHTIVSRLEVAEAMKKAPRGACAVM